MAVRVDLFGRARRRFACMALLVAAGLFGIVGGARATTYTVNSPADVPDADPQTAACETASGNGVCTLRAAVQQANAHAGADIILVPANTYLLSRVGHEYEALNGDLDVTDDVTIIGSGAGLTIIDGNGAVTGDRVFHLIGSFENTIKVNLVNMTIQHGAAGIYGGGVSISGAQTQIDGCVITGNSAASSMQVPGGGGIDNAGSLVLTNSVVSDNTIEDATALGGGIHSYGPLTISNSTISGNTSGGAGGGLYAETDADVVIANSTFSGNRATAGGGIYTTEATTTLINDTISGNSSNYSGGGIYVGTGTVGLYSATIAANVANADKNGGGGGAGIFNYAGASVALNNSILSGNSYLVDGSQFVVLADCSGTFASTGSNIVTHASCTINGPYSAIAAKLGPLQYNGGATMTHALLAGSPALDTGGPCVDDVGAPLGADQRGVPRPQGAACDIGAFELADQIFADDFDPST